MVHKGGRKAKGGLYWKKDEWEIVTVEGKSGTLPGTENIKYLRIPGTLFAPLALILGLALYLFIPLIGFAMLLSVVVKKIRVMFATPELLTNRGERPGDFRAPPDASRTAHPRTGGGLS